MNRVDVVITKIIDKPKQLINEEDCCWVVTVETDCYGQKNKKVIKRHSKSEIDKIKIGYSWQE